MVYGYQESYKERLQKCRPPQVSIYTELHDVLYLLDMSGNYKFDFCRHLQTTLSTISRQYNGNELVISQTPLKRSDQNFMYRSSRLYNILSRHAEKLNQNVDNIYWKFFEKSCNERVPGTWRILCLWKLQTLPTNLKTINWLELYLKKLKSKERFCERLLVQKCPYKSLSHKCSQ